MAECLRETPDRWDKILCPFVPWRWPVPMSAERGNDERQAGACRCNRYSRFRFATLKPPRRVAPEARLGQPWSFTHDRNPL